MNIIRLWCTMFKLSNPFIFKVANDFICSFLAFEALSDIVGLRSFVTSAASHFVGFPSVTFPYFPVITPGRTDLMLSAKDLYLLDAETHHTWI